MDEKTQFILKRLFISTLLLAIFVAYVWYVNAKTQSADQGLTQNQAAVQVTKPNNQPLSTPALPTNQSTPTVNGQKPISPPAIPPINPSPVNLNQPPIKTPSSTTQTAPPPQLRINGSDDNDENDD